MGWYASADESSRRAVIWCIATGALVQQLDPPHSAGPVCQVTTGGRKGEILTLSI